MKGDEYPLLEILFRTPGSPLIQKKFFSILSRLSALYHSARSNSTMTIRPTPQIDAHSKSTGSISTVRVMSSGSGHLAIQAASLLLSSVMRTTCRVS